MVRKILGATGRFGTRLGRSIREKIGRAEDSVKKSTKCPYCLKNKVKRQTVGIWSCEKCGAKFTARAYSFNAKSLLSGKKTSKNVEYTLDDTMPEAKLEETF